MLTNKVQFKFVNLDNNQSWFVTPIQAIAQADNLLTNMVEPKYRSNSSKHEAIIKIRSILENTNYSLRARFKCAQRVLRIFGHTVIFNIGYYDKDRKDVDDDDDYWHGLSE